MQRIVRRWKKKMPKISVCIPVYNGETYVAETIQSVLSQTYPDFELVIIDNASTDKTVSIVKSFTDSRIRLIQNETNVGMLENWNNCLRYGTNEYIQLLCADDVLVRDNFEKKVAVLEEFPEVGMVFSGSNIINETGKAIMKRRPFRSSGLWDGKRLARRSFRNHNYNAEPSNVMFRKSTSLKVGNFDPDLWFTLDWNYWLRMCTVTKVYYINELLYGFRISTTSETAQLLKTIDRIFDDDKLFVDKCYRQLNLGLTKTDVLVHQIKIRIRAYMRVAFMQLRKIIP